MGRFCDGCVKLNAHLFACAAALEEVNDQKIFENRPSNTYAHYLRPRFKKKRWKGPSGVEGWTAFFEGRSLTFTHSERILSEAGGRLIPV